MARIFDDSSQFIRIKDQAYRFQFLPQLECDPFLYCMAVTYPEQLPRINSTIEQLEHELTSYLLEKGWHEYEVARECGSVICTFIEVSLIELGPVSFALDTDPFLYSHSTEFIEQLKLNEIAQHGNDGLRVVSSVHLISQLWRKRLVDDTWEGEAYLEITFDDGTSFQTDPLNFDTLVSDLFLQLD